MKKTRYAKIVSTGHYVPEKTVTNAEMDQRYGQSLSAWIEANIGIQERHFAAINETPSDLAVQAARRALAKAKIEPGNAEGLVPPVTYTASDHRGIKDIFLIQAVRGSDPRVQTVARTSDPIC